jgi:hypothetical protein
MTICNAAMINFQLRLVMKDVRDLVRENRVWRGIRRPSSYKWVYIFLRVWCSASSGGYSYTTSICEWRLFLINHVGNAEMIQRKPSSGAIDTGRYIVS